MPALTQLVKEGDTFRIGEKIEVSCVSFWLGIFDDSKFFRRCIATPCHTQDSICFHVKDGEQEGVFTGDTLFLVRDLRRQSKFHVNPII